MPNGIKKLTDVIRPGSELERRVPGLADPRFKEKVVGTSGYSLESGDIGIDLPTTIATGISPPLKLPSLFVEKRGMFDTVVESIASLYLAFTGTMSFVPLYGGGGGMDKKREFFDELSRVCTLDNNKLGIGPEIFATIPDEHLAKFIRMLMKVKKRGDIIPNEILDTVNRKLRNNHIDREIQPDGSIKNLRSEIEDAIPMIRLTDLNPHIVIYNSDGTFDAQLLAGLTIMNSGGRLRFPPLEVSMKVKDGKTIISVEQTPPDAGGTYRVDLNDSPVINFPKELSEGDRIDIIYSKKGDLPRNVGTYYFFPAGVESPEFRLLHTRDKTEGEVKLAVDNGTLLFYLMNLHDNDSPYNKFKKIAEALKKQGALLGQDGRPSAEKILALGLDKWVAFYREDSIKRLYHITETLEMVGVTVDKEWLTQRIAWLIEDLQYEKFENEMTGLKPVLTAREAIAYGPVIKRLDGAIVTLEALGKVERALLYRERLSSWMQQNGILYRDGEAGLKYDPAKFAGVRYSDVFVEMITEFLNTPHLYKELMDEAPDRIVPEPMDNLAKTMGARSFYNRYNGMMSQVGKSILSMFSSEDEKRFNFPLLIEKDVVGAPHNPMFNGWAGYRPTDMPSEIDGRIYITIKPEHYRQGTLDKVFKILLDGMRSSRAKGLFAFKINPKYKAATRRDQIVIYFKAGSFAEVRRVAEAVVQQVGPELFGEKRPYFTRPLGRGLSFGEEPKAEHESFGGLRAKILEEAWKEIQAYEKGGGSPLGLEDRIRIIAYYLDKAGISTRDPAFNKGGEEKFPEMPK